jgi:hypothetical protein
MRWITIVVLSAAIAFSREPEAPDQTAMQATLTRYFRAVNTCKLTAARSEVIDGYEPPDRALPPALLAKINGRSCAAGNDGIEFAVLARSLTMLNQETAVADGFFRTIGFTLERAGRIHIVFVRQSNAWKIGAVRFAPALEPPNYPIPVAATHDPAGAEGWTEIDASKVVDITGGAVTSVWELNGGTIQSLSGHGRGRDIRTKDSYRNFELRFEWKVTPAANSGVKYRLFYFFADSERGASATGYEYQIVDNDGDPGAKKFAVERAASLYNQVAAETTPRPVGEWNEGRIVAKGAHVEHWLNGKKVLEVECESSTPESPIVFQHHGGGVSLRNIRIRRLD